MKYIVDRIEDDIVILEKYPSEEMIEIDKRLLSDNVKEGSVIIFQDNRYYLDEDEEAKRRAEILEKFRRLRNKDED